MGIITPSTPTGPRAAERTPVPTAAAPRRRIAGLDGLRAVAVIAVVFFHLNPDYLPGGFLGVDIFFVISGYLITKLLLTEAAATGRIRLGRFYLRRARRLLPAVLLLLSVVTLAGLLVWRDQVPTLGGSVLSSLGYVTNWWLIFDHQSYFVATGRPPMLQHLWSLAIEEQYYLVWAPLLIALTGLVVARRRGARPVVVAAVAAALAICSTVAMAVIAIRTGVPYQADSSRVYFGTDTHTMGLLIGSAAGALSVLPTLPGRLGRIPGGRVPGWATDVLAAAGLAGLIYWMGHVNEYDPYLYRGGFLAFSALALLVVCTAARRVGRAGGWLDVAPLRWIGERSYSIYLWHWPVFVVTRPGIDVQGPQWLIDLARCALAVALAAASYRYVEVPLRRRAWASRSGEGAASGSPSGAGAGAAAGARAGAGSGVGTGARTRVGAGARRWLLPATVAACVAVLIPAAVAAGGTGSAEAGPALPAPVTAAPGPATGPATGGPGAPATALAPTTTPGDGASGVHGVGRHGPATIPGVDPTHQESPAERPPATTHSNPPSAATHRPPTATPSTSAPSTVTPTTRPPATAPPTTAPPTTAPPAAGGSGAASAVVSAFGDSVLLGAAPALQSRVASLRLDAVVGRQAWSVLDDIDAAHAAGSLAPVVLIHIGNNGIISPGQLGDTLGLLADRRQVIVLNDHVDRDWQGPNNATLAAVVPRYHNATLLDWNAVAVAHPAWFYHDGLHVNPDGAAGYANLIAAAIK